MSSRVRHAIILAAGMGMRLRSVVDSRPKGLIEIDGETLVGRSVRLLGAAGIEHITIVTGFAAGQYKRFAAGRPQIHLAYNENYATTGSMASLAIALDRVQHDVLVLESDLVYEMRALTHLLESSAHDATVISGPTAAGDEVWVYAPGGRLQSMSKSAHELRGVTGEFVGITRLSPPAAEAMLHAYQRFVAANGHARMNYETDALVAISRLHSIAGLLIPDLCWGEVDDDRQFERVVRRVWPAVGDRLPPL